jgi:hypothetical protein
VAAPTLGLVDLEAADIFRCCRVRWAPEEHGEAPHETDIVTLRVFVQATHGHVFRACVGAVGSRVLKLAGWSLGPLLELKGDPPCSKADQSPLNLSLLPFNAPGVAPCALPRSGSCLGAKRDGISETQSAKLAPGRRELGLAVNASCEEAVCRLSGVEFSVASYVSDKRATVEFSKKAEGVMTRRVSGCAYARTGGE